ncbi:MAG: carbon-nitrogen hydrolase family protein [Janthinobacterium lividum]
MTLATASSQDRSAAVSPADSRASAAPAAPFRVAALQMVSAPDLQRNLDDACALIAEAAAAGAGLALLPEYFCYMGRRDTDKVALAEAGGDTAHGLIQHTLSQAAREHRIWIIGGTLPVRGDDPTRVLNTTFVYGPDGAQAGRYDKIHLFNFVKGEDAFDEARTIEPGRTVASFAAPFGRVGLSICYDLRFPELYRALGDCALIVVPSAFTYTTGQAHWEILLRARAIENQCYVLAAAQGGEHPTGRRTWGHSMLIDPWGEIVAVRDTGPGIVTGLIEPQRIADVRQSLPAWRHRVLA